MTWGIDISNHQPAANLGMAKNAGCSFVFAKASEGLTYKDPTFAGFRDAATRLGLPFGGYHFARPQPGRAAADEAREFLKTVGTVRDGEMPCVLDLEYSGLPAVSTTAWALEWLRVVHDATNVRPLLYTYTAFAQANLFPDPALAQYPLWLANYRSLSSPPSAPTPWSKWAIWQHTSSSVIPGIPGSCDRNTTNLTVPQLRTLGRPLRDPASPLPPFPAPKPAPSKGLNVKIIDLRDVAPYVTGPGVKPMQRLLGVPADGLAGPGTRAALIAAQKRCGLTADAIFGPATAEALLAGK